MDTHSSILAWRISWTEEPGGYSPWDCRVGHDWVTDTFTILKYFKLNHKVLYLWVWLMEDYYLSVITCCLDSLWFLEFCTFFKFEAVVKSSNLYWSFSDGRCFLKNFTLRKVLYVLSIVMLKSYITSFACFSALWNDTTH